MNGPPNGPTPPSIPPDGAGAGGTRVAFQVTADTTERLDRFLADQLALSRTQAGRLIGGGAVSVNGVAGRAGRPLVRGDLIEVRFAASERRRPLRPHPRDLDIVYEDEHLLVLNKPAGLVVHPAPGHWDDTLVNALIARDSPLSSGTAGRPGVVHRLDRDTSGLLIIAKTDEAHRRLGSALAARRVERRYVALVWGHLKGRVEIDAPIARHPRERKRMTVLATGRPACSIAEPVARFDVCDLIRVQLATGRTHQIRVHLAHIGHPVIGDRVYGGGGSRRMTGQQRARAGEVERATPRQALHAASLAFAHPMSREWLVFKADWPSDLRPGLEAASGDRELLARPMVLDYLGVFK